MNKLVEQRRAEFTRFVWNHGVDVFQAKFDKKAKLDDAEESFLLDLLAKEHLGSLPEVIARLDAGLRDDPDHLRLLMQLVGLTRNKIVQDLKAFSRSTGEKFSTSTAKSILNHKVGRIYGLEYLGRQVLRVFGPAKGAITPQLLEAVNQATWPGYIRQERAKRMGHEAEGRVATLLKDCKLDFAPEDKAENPLCGDLKIGGISYDLVSPSAEKPSLRIKSTVHSSNIGQYGQSKDDLEVREAKRSIAEQAASGVTLLAFIDGVGFESNSAGLNGVLGNADEFCQFRTIWKAAVIAASKVRRSLTVALPPDQLEHFKPFAERFRGRLVSTTMEMDADSSWTPAGDGFIKTG